MGMTRARKQEEIEDLKARMGDAEIIVLTQNKGLDAKSITEIRLEMRKNEVGFKVVKNTLAKIAAKDTNAEAITDMFAGPVAMATSKDPVAAAKTAHEFAKKNKNLVVLGGIYGDMVLDEAGVKQLASMPSLDELRATIAAIIMSPARNLAGAVKAPGGNVAGAVKAIAEKAE
jgi:large subunit ribosomal protein L10